MVKSINQPILQVLYVYKKVALYIRQVCLVRVYICIMQGMFPAVPCCGASLCLSRFSHLVPAAIPGGYTLSASFLHHPREGGGTVWRAAARQRGSTSDTIYECMMKSARSYTVAEMHFLAKRDCLFLRNLSSRYASSGVGRVGQRAVPCARGVRPLTCKHKARRQQRQRRQRVIVAR